MSMPSFEESARLRRRSRGAKSFYDLCGARRTLPLLRRVLGDVVAVNARLAHQRRDLEKLQTSRRKDWHIRQEQLRLTDAIRSTRRQLGTARGELESLGPKVLDSAHGIVGFPTIVNGSLAFLVFRHEDEDFRFWRYRDQPKLREIPSGWFVDEAEDPRTGDGLMT